MEEKKKEGTYLRNPVHDAALQVSTLLQVPIDTVAKLGEGEIVRVQEVLKRQSMCRISGGAEVESEMLGNCLVARETKDGVEGTRIGLSLHFSASLWVDTTDDAKVREAIEKNRGQLVDGLIGQVKQFAAETESVKHLKELLPVAYQKADLSKTSLNQLTGAGAGPPSKEQKQ